MLLTFYFSLGIQQRIPSPRELQFHTQSIMQNALIKKKLEEQRENFRKRQEMQQQQIPMNQNTQNSNKGIVAKINFRNPKYNMTIKLLKQKKKYRFRHE